MIAPGNENLNEVQYVLIIHALRVCGCKVVLCIEDQGW